MSINLLSQSQVEMKYFVSNESRLHEFLFCNYDLIIFIIYRYFGHAYSKYPPHILKLLLTHVSLENMFMNGA